MRSAALRIRRDKLLKRRVLAGFALRTGAVLMVAAVKHSIVISAGRNLVKEHIFFRSGNLAMDLNTVLLERVHRKSSGERDRVKQLFS